jgi:phenylalanyl-tRNA synthetase alpha chain
VTDEARSLREQALLEIEAISDPAALDAARTRWLGRSGEITRRLRAVSTLPDSERPAAGKAWNETRAALERAIDERRAALESSSASRAASSFDPTLPGRRPPVGLPHVLLRTIDDLVDLFRTMGFGVAEGPEVETSRNNFEALNIPEGHPTRDDHDSFFLSDDLLLRTQTSPVQIRVMERTKPPFRVIAPGRVYRRDAFDASHSPFFFQLEGLCVGEDVTIGDLKGTLRAFAHRFFGDGIGLRFRVGYFPFTEPSMELDIACTVCGGPGCAVCKYSGWVEILGSGMVHPNVLRGVGYDPDVVSGYAFGMGPDRITLLKHRIPDIRLLYENDLRFLHQFPGVA